MCEITSIKKLFDSFAAFAQCIWAFLKATHLWVWICNKHVCMELSSRCLGDRVIMFGMFHAHTFHLTVSSTSTAGIETFVL